ncbi:MAG: NAD(P)/FAD-dependent oxidoreductase [Oligoflexales bacterium]
MGKGIGGLAVAFRLVRRRIPCRIIHSPLSVAATRCSGGIMASKGIVDPRTDLFRAKLDGAKNFPNWLREIEAESGQKIIHGTTGVFEPFFSEEDRDSIASRVYRDRSFREFGTELLGPELRGFPFASLRVNMTNHRHPDAGRHPERSEGSHSIFDKNPTGFFFYPADSWYDPASVVEALEKTLIRNGVPIIEQKIEKITSRDGGFVLQGNGEELHVKDLVLAAGDGIKDIRFDFETSLPKMVSVYGETLVLEKKMMQELPLVKGKFSLLALRERTIFSGSSFNDTRWIASNHENKQHLLDKLRQSFGMDPALAAARIVQGTRIRTRDRQPVVGRVKTNVAEARLFVLTGLYKSGFQLADDCARQLCSMIIEESRLPYPFDVGRYYS